MDNAKENGAFEYAANFALTALHAALKWPWRKDIKKKNAFVKYNLLLFLFFATIYFHL